MFYPNIQQERERKKEAIGMVGGVMAIAGVSQVVSMINSTLGINPSLVTQILEGVAVTMGPVLFKNSIAKSLEAKALDPTLLNYVKEQKLLGLDGVPFVKKLIKLDRVDYANWLVVRLMTHKQQIKYAIYAAEQVIKIFEVLTRAWINCFVRKSESVYKSL